MKRELVFACLVVVSSLAFAQEKLPPGVIAKMGDVELKAEELKLALDTLTNDQKAQIASQPQELGKLVRVEMIRRVLANEARSKGWEKRPDVVLQMERAREQALVANYMNSLVRAPDGYPSDAEIKAAYDQNSASFTQPKQYRVSQIFVLAPPETEKAAFTKAQNKANDVAAQARKRPDEFAALAKANSEHKESAEKGGEMGWVVENNLIPELRTPVASMRKGEVSGAVRGTLGWHIVRLEDLKERSVRPLTEVRDQISAALRFRKAQENEQAYLTLMTNKTPVSVNDSELQKLQGALK